MDYTQIKLLGRRFLRMSVGFVLMAIACSMQVQANLGYGAWTVLDHGLTQHLPLTIGLASILSSAVIVAIDVLSGEKIGVGMPLNMVAIGLLMDVILGAGLIPAMPGLNGPDGLFSWGAALSSGAMLLGGIALLSLSACIYMSAGLGGGPRDTLMVVLMRWTGKDIALCRNALEIGALVIGFLLGGSVGIGTLMVATLSGPTMQAISRAMRFNPKAIRPITFDLLPGVLTGKIRLDDEAFKTIA